MSASVGECYILYLYAAGCNDAPSATEMPFFYKFSSSDSFPPLCPVANRINDLSFTILIYKLRSLQTRKKRALGLFFFKNAFRVIFLNPGGKSLCLWIMYSVGLLVDHSFQVLSIPAFSQFIGQLQQLFFADKTIPVSHFFNTSNFGALPLFNHFYKFAGIAE